MTMVAPAALVQGVARTPLPYGLFSQLTFRPGAGDRWETGVQWETITCEPIDRLGAFTCVSPVNEVQRITITGAPTGGSFTLTYKGHTTAPIAYNASAAQVASALSLITADTFTASGGALPGSFVVITFTGYAENKPQLVATGSLTGGTSPAVAVTTTTAGVEQGVTASGLPKSLDIGSGAVEAASPFSVYGSWSCAPVGFDPTRAFDLASAHLLAREEQGVEQALWTGDLGNVPNFQAEDTDSALVNSTAASVVRQLAWLEANMGAAYGSAFMIHLTRDAALIGLQLGAIVATGNRLTTKLGTPVVAGSGYKGNVGPSTPSAGQVYAYATPPVFGYRSEVIRPSDGSWDLFDRDVNQLTAVAERVYLLGFDTCAVAAALMSLGS